MNENEILNEEPPDGKAVGRGNGAVNNHQSIGTCRLDLSYVLIVKTFSEEIILTYSYRKRRAMEFKLVNKKLYNQTWKIQLFSLPTFVYILEQVKVLTANQPIGLGYR